MNVVSGGDGGLSLPKTPEQLQFYTGHREQNVELLALNGAKQLALPQNTFSPPPTQTESQTLKRYTYALAAQLQSAGA